MVVSRVDVACARRPQQLLEETASVWPEAASCRGSVGDCKARVRTVNVSIGSPE